MESFLYPHIQRLLIDQRTGDNMILGSIQKGSCRFIFFFRRFVANFAQLGHYVASLTPGSAFIASNIIGEPSEILKVTGIRGVK